MNFLQFIPLTAAIINFGLTLFVLSRNLKGAVNRVYLLWGLSVTLWNAGTFLMFTAQSQAEALRWAQLLQFGVIFLPISLAHLCLLMAQISWGRWMKVLYAIHIGFALGNLTPWFVEGVRHAEYGAYYTMGGPLFTAFVPFYCTPVAAVIAFNRKLAEAPTMQRTRLHAMMLVIALLIVFGVNDTLPIVGIYTYPVLGTPIYPLGSLACIVYGIVVSYSVLQHQLLDVHVALGRLTAHLLRFVFLFVIGLTLQLIIQLVTGEAFTREVAFFSSLAVLLLSTLIASFLFPKLIGSHSEQLERRLLGDRFEYHDQVRSFIESMTWYSDVTMLLNDLHEVLTRSLRLSSYQIILRDETNRGFTLFRSHPEQPARSLPELKAQSPVFQFFEWGKAEYLSVNPEYVRPGESVLERQAREPLLGFGAHFCFPLTSEKEPFGLVLVGQKMSREPYTATDITLLVELVKNMSLMVNQIRLKAQILQAQELELLGRMSRGMAHDLNNLLTPVWTLLQLSSEAGNAALDEELLPVALRNVKTMRAYIKEALFFSENLRPDLQLGRLDLVVRQAMDLARASRPKDIQMIAETPGEVLAEMDEVLIERLIANLIANAIDASPSGSQIRIQLERLARTEASRDWLRVRVIDYGEGIPKENLNRIFTPYFTTKNRGDETRGFGLGLAICRKIVNLHGGNLSVTSQPRKGTTVQFDLPSHPVKSTVPSVAAKAL
ncbi:MAG: two-component system, NtrC family, sensor kinase [Chthoniobacter sp.]|jgi:signal transduction histidine kinase|nr:two-component system, NtrC family, sensor kinase [Chthoniobacter sp.]